MHKINKDKKMITISRRSGFTLFACDNGISSTVFEKNGYVYKITTRNSVQRAQSDYDDLVHTFTQAGWGDKLQSSVISACTYERKKYTCVKQKIIVGTTFARMGKQAVMDYLKKHPRERQFLHFMIDLFIARITAKLLYPDSVGNPHDQSMWNSINMIIEEKRGIVLCDVGLSPREKTLQENGLQFYESDNVKHYNSKMNEALQYLKGIE